MGLHVRVCGFVLVTSALVGCSDDGAASGESGWSEVEDVTGASGESDGPGGGTTGGGSSPTADGGDTGGADTGAGDESGEAPPEPSTRFDRARQWGVPQGGWMGQGFVRLSGSVTDTGDEDWTTTDLTGDGVPDLVVTGRYDGEAFEVLGHGSGAHWNVYAGGPDGFATSATQWSVPEGGWTGQGFVRLWGSVTDAGDEDWTTTDLTGDGIPDLVVTGRYDGEAFEVLGHGGGPHWNVYEGGPDGFATSATQWSVPEGGWTGQGFVRLWGSVTDAGDEDWTTTDLTGDGIPDLVVTGRYDGEAFEVLGHDGGPHWNVYEGGPDGFATSATQWSVPEGGWTGQGFVRLSGGVTDAGDEDWTTTDLTGDGIPDLVVTGRYDGEAFEVLGHGNGPRWDVYAGGAGGFAASATPWSVPGGGWSGQGFVRLSGSVTDAGDEDWTTTDLTGDGVPDLVVTGRYDGTAFEVLGHGDSPRWDVYTGGPDGFAASASPWSVPAGGWMGQGFARLAGTVADPGDEDWTTIDLNGDGLLDLVVTGHYDGTAFEVLGHGAEARWDLHIGSAGGFAEEPVAWPVPAGGWSDRGFARPSGTVSGAGDEDWTTTDLDGDGHPDLIITGDYDGDALEVLGHGDSPYWRAFLGTP